VGLSRKLLIEGQKEYASKAEESRRANLTQQSRIGDLSLTKVDFEQLKK
jgi:hypothetical protein